MDMKNLVVLPAATGFFAPLGDSIVQHYKSKGEEAILVTSSASEFSLSPLTQSSLVEDLDWIRLERVSSFLQDLSGGVCGCNLVIWLFNDQTYNESIGLIIDQITAHASCQLAYSIYPDGWLNKFWQVRTFFRLACDLESRGFQPKDRFHFACIHPHSVMDSFSDIILSNISHSLSRTYHSASYLPSVQGVIESLALKVSHSDSIILVALRPWGSSTFHGGRYAFNSADAKLSCIILETIEVVCANFNLNSPLVVLRRDNRETEYMNHVVREISSTNLYQIADISNDIPHWIPLDCLFYHLKLHDGIVTPIFIIAQDSSTPVAPAVIGLSHTAIYGYPSHFRSILDPDCVAYIDSNLIMQKSLIEKVSGSQAFDLDESLFAIEISKYT